MSNPNRQSAIGIRHSAFTLTEMILVMAIIVVLIGLLIPTVSRVRASGQRTRSEAVIRNIANAIGAYQMQFRAYPGVLTNNDLIGGGATKSINRAGGGTVQLTSSENLLLALTGGMVNNGGTIEYDVALLGTGPRNLAAAGGRQFPPFLEGIAHSTPGGNFQDADGYAATDSIVPEFLDGYEATPLPVLYIRANIGRTGIASEDVNTQYNAAEVYPYTRQLAGGSTHGLRALGANGDPLLTSANTARPYLRSTTIADTPRNPDGFVLIGAGPDRIYGTQDDITSFGAVIP